MRETFIKTLVKEARNNKKIFLIVGDLGYSVVESFANEFPDRFLNIGVAEQNMMGVAAGIASEGYHVFVYSIANFPTFRCAEQIRNDIDYHKYTVTIVSVGGGLVYGALGYSHHAIQDYALMRSMPNILIAAPGDNMEVEGCLKYLLKNPQPSYLRIGKLEQKNYHLKIPKVEPGKWLNIFEKNNDISKKIFLTTGAVINTAHTIINKSKKYSNFKIMTMPLWSQKSKKIQFKNIKKFYQIVTLEDHLEDGGFGSWLLESVQEKKLTDRISIKAFKSDICGHVGSQSTLNNIGWDL